MSQTVLQAKNNESAQDNESKDLTPGEYLKREMQLQGLSAPELAEELEVHAQTIYNVTSGARQISSKLAVKLAVRFARPVEFWLDGRILPEPQPFVGNAPSPESGQIALGRSAAITSNILVDHEIHSSVKVHPGSGLDISPYLEANVSPASYDLTVGLIVKKGFGLLDKSDWGLICKYVYADESLGDKDRGEVETLLNEYALDIDYCLSATIDSLESVGIVLREQLKFSGDFCARVGGTAKHARSGLSVVNGLQVDPGYSGPMLVTVFNIGLDREKNEGKLPIEAGDKILSIEVIRLGSTPNHPYDKETDSKIARIVDRLSDEIAGIFEYDEIKNENRYNVILNGNPDQSFICDGSLKDARIIAVKRVVASLTQGNSVNLYMLPFTRILGQVTIDRDENLAVIHRFPGSSEEARKRALASFNDGSERRTLKDVLRQLELEPGVAIAKLMGLKGSES